MSTSCCFDSYTERCNSFSSPDSFNNKSDNLASWAWVQAIFLSLAKQALLGVAVGATILFAAIWIGAAIGCSLTLALIALELLLGVKKETLLERVAFPEFGPISPYTRIYVVVIAPLAEEILFRGMIQPTISLACYYLCINAVSKETTEKVRQVTAVFFTAVLFSLAHLFNHYYLEAAIIQLTVSFVGGLVLGTLSEYSGSILPGIFSHGTWNFIVSDPYLSMPLAPIFEVYGIMLKAILS